MPTSQPLPPKEKTLFNRILKCYEQKQYKNGLKFAKQILSNPKFAEHGETLAMKGLTLNCTGKKEEAYELVKRGLKNDLKSHVCWHVYGLLQRSDKKYDEAIKCYRNALRWDKENLHILRDLSMLQVHMRDIEGYRETRHALLQLKPGQRAPWIGYAIANHLLKDYTVAFKVLEEFGKTQQEMVYEHSELLLYQNYILQEAGLFQQAMEHLETNKEKIVDKLSWLEYKGDLCVKLDRLEDAEKIFTSLVNRNPENHSYYQKLESVIKPSNAVERLQIYDAVSAIFPKADSPKSLPLTFLTGPMFQERIDKIMREQLKRGVPPLFVSLKPLYKEQEKVKCIGEIAEQFIRSLEANSKFSPDDEEIEPPTTLLWARFFHAQHLDKIKEYEKALQLINESLEHTPTLIELHVLKAKVLKHLGDTAGAVASMDEAQSLDTADRFINCKCAAYMIRNDMISDAEETAAKFTRENVSIDEYLKEMQCMWYEVACADAHSRANRYGEALKKCHEVDKHFTEIIEDQFDFHQYCMRKMTLRSYVKMLKLEDSLRSHRFYFQAAKTAIKVYIHLHDEPYQPGDRIQDEKESSMSNAELKKLRNKQRRQERKKAAAEERKKNEQHDKSGKKKQQVKNNKTEDDAEVKKEEEFAAEKLVSVCNPLEQAQKFLAPLELYCSSKFETHYLAFQIAERRGTLLVMLRALLRAQKVAKESDMPNLHACRVRFAKKVRDAKDLPTAASEVISLHMKIIGCDIDVEKLNEQFITTNPNSLTHIFAGACSLYHLNSSRKDEALKMILSINSNTQNVSLKVCEIVLRSLQGKLDFGIVETDIAAEFREKCHAIFPRACFFLSPQLAAEQNGNVNGHPAINGLDSNPESGDLKPEHKQVNNNSNKLCGIETSARAEDHCLQVV
ncbi:N-alpha-acetyltransferase 15, NatA auxiliary subunit-like [Ciona intestinalis]